MDYLSWLLIGGIIAVLWLEILWVGHMVTGWTATLCHQIMHTRTDQLRWIAAHRRTIRTALQRAIRDEDDEEDLFLESAIEDVEQLHRLEEAELPRAIEMTRVKHTERHRRPGHVHLLSWQKRMLLAFLVPACSCIGTLSAITTIALSQSIVLASLIGLVTISSLITGSLSYVYIHEVIEARAAVRMSGEPPSEWAPEWIDSIINIDYLCSHYSYPEDDRYGVLPLYDLHPGLAKPLHAILLLWSRFERRHQ